MTMRALILFGLSVCVVFAGCAARPLGYASDAGMPFSCTTIVQPQICEQTRGCKTVKDCCVGLDCVDEHDSPPSECPFECPLFCGDFTDPSSCDSRDAAGGGVCHSTYLDGAFTICIDNKARCTPTTGDCLVSQPTCDNPFVSEYGDNG